MKLILKYFPNLTDDQIQKFKELEVLYKEWNSRINVISRKDIDDLYLKHVLHSLSIAKFISFKKNTSILDVGTGGGFPGIPLAIIFPDCNFLLVDSINKKINVVKEISNTLKLTNVSYNAIRVEKLKTKHDFIVSRAVTRMNKFRNLVKGLISNKNDNKIKNGIIYLKGGDLTDEMMNIKHQKVNISDYFDEEFFETKKIVYLEN
jgi:16S rRNA (guanine527-N7)-methyltransferase|tara:strand:+ start:2713 stop:3327 length:615 start_codon:yes stop_codon:yes gene_type:complete